MQVNDQAPKEYYESARAALTERMYTFDEWTALDTDSKHNVTRD